MRLKNRHIVLWVISVIGCLIFRISLTDKNTVNDVVTQNNLIVHYSSYCNCTRQFAGHSSDGREHWCSEEATMRGSGQNIIAYSLYGNAVRNKRLATYYLVLNSIPREVGQFYPGMYWESDVSNSNFLKFKVLRFFPSRMVHTSVSQYNTGAIYRAQDAMRHVLQPSKCGPV